MTFWAAVIIATASFYSLVMQQEIESMQHAAWQQHTATPVAAKPVEMAAK